MIRAMRPNAMAQNDATLVPGWNITPNLEYVLRLIPGASSCAVLLFAQDDTTLVATGAVLTGEAQPCVLLPQSGQTIGMVDPELQWHLQITTVGDEFPRVIRIGPAVDLPDEVHPIYMDLSLAVVKATAVIDAASHYADEILLSLPHDTDVWIGDVVQAPVDSVDRAGQAESLLWTAGPNGAICQLSFIAQVPIAPDAWVDPTPPEVADDIATATHLTGATGNVLTNDQSGIVVSSVNGLASLVGAAVAGTNGGSFVLSSDGTWTFDPVGQFGDLNHMTTRDTAITYTVFDGVCEAEATLTITVTYENTPPVVVDTTGTTDALTLMNGEVLSSASDPVDNDPLHISKVAGFADNVGVQTAGSNGGLFNIQSDGTWVFNPNGEFEDVPLETSVFTAITYHVSDGYGETQGTLTMEVWGAEDVLYSPVAGGLSHSISVQEGGIVFAAGSNTYSQYIGNGMTNAIAVEASTYCNIVLLDDGTVRLWHNSLGITDPGWTDIKAIDAGELFFLGLKKDGTVVGYGETSYNRRNCDSWTDIVSVKGGGQQSIGLKADGTVLYTGRYSYSTAAFVNIVNIGLGYKHFIGAKFDGTCVASGDNTYGQLDVSGWTDVIQVACGSNHSVGLKSDGTCVACGFNTSGQCNVSGWTDIVYISCGDNHTLGVRHDGSVIAAGPAPQVNQATNVAGWVVGVKDGPGGGGGLTVPKYQPVGCGNVFTFGVKPDGTLYYAGNTGNSYYTHASLTGIRAVGCNAYGIGFIETDNTGQPVALEAWTDLDWIDAGESFVLGLKSDGTVLGSGAITSYNRGQTRDWINVVKVACGAQHSIGLTKNGLCYFTGRYAYNVLAWRDIIDIGAGYNFIVGLKSDGTLVGAGTNDVGQLDFTTWTDIVKIAVGWKHTIGIKADGTCVACGSNTSGQCNVSGWTDIVFAAGYDHTIGVMSDGSCVGVGSNSSGQRNVSTWSVALPPTT